MIEQRLIRFKLTHESSQAPFRGSEGASGYDLFVRAINEDFYEEHEPFFYKIQLGVAFEIPPGVEGQIRLRSSAGLNGLNQANAPGTIDSDYRGEVGVIVQDLLGLMQSLSGKEPRPCPFDIGDRIAQIVFCPVPPVRLVQSEVLSKTTRGSCGFGSTGRR